MIPEERKNMLIGKGGSVKKIIEKNTHTKIFIDESIEIKGEDIGVMTAKNVVQAIGRGFSPKKAFLLFDEQYHLDIISLRGETSNTIKRLKGRIIGRKGKIKSEIEKITDCFISVYGKTISIIGPWDKIPTATKCIELLIEGKNYSTVFKYLKNRKGIY